MNKPLIDIHPNAWDFGNYNKQLRSDKQKYKVEYGELYEIAMGAPLGGQCFLLTENGEKYLIDKWCAGPPIWDYEGMKIAIPKWTKSFWSGTKQQIAILDTKIGVLTIYKRKFDVLDLRSFDKNEIYGYDSPIHKPKVVKFDLTKENIEKTLKVVDLNPRKIK